VRARSEDAEDGRHFGAIISHAHRGTANRSDKFRPLVLGIEAPDATRRCSTTCRLLRRSTTLPNQVRRHLACRLVDQLEPIVQAHSIEGCSWVIPDQSSMDLFGSVKKNGGVLALSLTLKPIAQTYSD